MGLDSTYPLMLPITWERSWASNLSLVLTGSLRGCYLSIFGMEEMFWTWADLFLLSLGLLLACEPSAEGHEIFLVTVLHSLGFLAKE